MSIKLKALCTTLIFNNGCHLNQINGKVMKYFIMLKLNGMGGVFVFVPHRTGSLSVLVFEL